MPPGAIPAKGAPVASLEDLRDRIQQGEINALKWMAPDKDAGPIERGLRYAAMTGTHLAAGIAQAPLNALVFAEQGGPGPGGLTYNPQTGAMNLTPEAMAAASLGANPLRFGGALKPQLGPWPAPELIRTSDAGTVPGRLQRRPCVRAAEYIQTSLYRRACRPPTPGQR